MSHFYGSIKGNKGEATRCGSKGSGYTAVAASWEGCVKVELFRKDDEDWARVRLATWLGAGTSMLLYLGPVSGPKAPSDIDKALRCRTCSEFSNWEAFTKGEKAKCAEGPSVEGEQHGS